MLKSYFRRSKIVLPAISHYLWIPPIPLPMILAPTCSQLLIPSSSIPEGFCRGFSFLLRRGNWNRDGGQRRRSATSFFSTTSRPWPTQPQSRSQSGQTRFVLPCSLSFAVPGQRSLKAKAKAVKPGPFFFFLCSLSPAFVLC